MKKHVNHFIAVSESVKQNLINHHDILEGRIDVIHGFISPSNERIHPVLKKELNIPEESIIVGGCGGEPWRKGEDLFLQLAISVLRKTHDFPIYFVWLGGKHNEKELYQLHHDIETAGISNRVFLLPSVPNPMDYFIEMDIFAMTSREDPYPVVNLELASLGKPIVCFDDAGGSPEFVEADAGFIVPYLDVEAMAEKVSLLSKDKKLRTKLGERAREKVLSRHDINVAAPKILNVMRKFI